jgi:hypothetical protein
MGTQVTLATPLQFRDLAENVSAPGSPSKPGQPSRPVTHPPRVYPRVAARIALGRAAPTDTSTFRSAGGSGCHRVEKHLGAG